MKTSTWLASVLACSLVGPSLPVARARGDDRGAGPFAIPTFHCLGLYWSPPGGAEGKQVRVRYRRQGGSEWSDGLPMCYNPIPGTDEDLTDYRGSLVHLEPATTYEVELGLSGMDTTARLTAETWSEDFPFGETVRVSGRDTPLAITESGTSGGYRDYDGRGATIDVRHEHDACITVRASHVILRGFTLKGAGAAKGPVKGIIGALRIDGGHDIVIEDCDISDWGRLDPSTGFGKDYDAAIYYSVTDRARLSPDSPQGEMVPPSRAAQPGHGAGSHRHKQGRSAYINLDRLLGHPSRC